MKPLAQSFQNLGKQCVWMVALLVSAAPAWASSLTVTNTADSGAGSLRAAIASANTGDSIRFSGALGGQTIHLTSGPLVIGKRVIIDNTGGGVLFIDGGGQGGQDTSVFVITNSADVDFFDITVTNGNNFAGKGYGGGIDVDSGSLVLFGCTVSGNSAANNGGGIYCNQGAAIYLENGCTVSGNSCFGYGGGICASIGSTVSILDTTVTGNSSETGGNGIALLYATTATLADSTVSNNFDELPPALGGAIFNESATLTISNCVLSGNFNQIGAGGAVENFNSGTVRLINSTLSGNIAGTGGAIENEFGCLLTITNCTISGNSLSGNSSGMGGAGICNLGTMILDLCTLSNNIAGSFYGGGVYNGGLATLDNCTLSGNSSVRGGGMENQGSATVNNCTVWGNSATAFVGGGVHNGSGFTVALNNCTLSGNSAGNALGGGMENDGTAASFMMTNTVVAGNLPSGNDVFGNYSGANNVVGGNPKLAPLGNYGGAVQTMVPLYGSPLIDAGTDSATSFLATDQRGYPRLSGAHVDIGATEAQFAASIHPPLLIQVVQSGTQLQFAFTNAPNVDFTALMSTNLNSPLSNWTVLGNVTEVSSGEYQFTDASATNRAQFYRVVSP